MGKPSKPKIRVVTRKAQPHVLHEINEKGEHRLVLVQEEENETSGWYPRHEVGFYKGYCFNTSVMPLPQGVFRAHPVPFRKLLSHGNIGERLGGEAMACVSAKTDSTPTRRR